MNINNREIEFSIIGCGRLGVSLAVFLAREGFVPKAFVSRRVASAENAVSMVGAGRVCTGVSEAVREAPLVFITTPDGVIESVCDQVASAGEFSTDHVVYHLSGALSSSILSSARKDGAHTGSIHPLQSFAPYEEGALSPFKGINISIEGSELAVDLGKEIVNALGANFFIIPTEAKTLYHASAVVASNYLVTLEHFALSLLAQAGLDPERGYDILEPLILGTLKNIKAGGTIKALTGPVARGDETIIQRHLADIDGKMPEFTEIYKLLGRHTVDIARQRGEMDKATIQRIAALFDIQN